MQACKACKVEHLLADFETYTVKGAVKYRLECKTARHDRRKRANENAPPVDPNTVPLPGQCVKCGASAPKASFQWRKDLVKPCWRTVCNVCISLNASGVAHYTAARARAMEKDPVGFRARNAATHLAWAHRNPDKIKKNQTLQGTLPERKFKALVSYVAYKYGKEDMLDLEDKQVMTHKMTVPCHYCDHAPARGDKLNGLDRLDPSGRYTDANTVPCCGVCNAMKLTFTVDEFLQGVRDIVTFNELDVEDHAAIQRPGAFGGTAARRAADSDKMTSASLSKDNRVGLWAGGCYQCGRGPSFGIDRLDATKPYSSDNCKSCCTTCNYMKKDHEINEFMGHLSRIFKHTSMWVIGDTRNVLSGVTGQRKPVAVLGGGANGTSPLIIFPSVGCAATVLGSVRGVSLAPVDVCEYKRQRMSPGTATRLIMSMRCV